MIISLDAVKTALNIDGPDDDETLTSMVDSVASFIEGETKCRFDEPVPVTEYHSGSGWPQLFLHGHIDVDTPSLADVTVEERLFYGDTWDAFTDFERRDDILIRIDDCWWTSAEYKIMYLKGYRVAPADIRAVALELVVNSFRADQSAADGSSGITSETLVGVYSYTIARNQTTANAVGGGNLSSIARRTLNRYQRKLV